MIWMDFIMLVWKKADTTHIFIILVLLWPGISYSTISTGIDIQHANGTFDEENYLINANIQYRFGEEIQDALDHGIAIQIDIHLLAKQQRKWIWDKIIKSSTISYRLEHLPLSDHYQVTNLRNYHRKHFQNLPVALNYIGLIKDYSLLERGVFNPNENYLARIRAQLNIHELPAPLRLLAYVSSTWRLNSPWYEWVIQQ